MEAHCLKPHVSAATILNGSDAAAVVLMKISISPPSTDLLVVILVKWPWNR